MELKSQIQRLFELYESDFGTYAWMYESDRFDELIFCLLNQFNQQDTEASRRAVNSLNYLGLLKMDKLAALEAPGNEDAIVLAYVLRRHGVSEENSQIAVRLFAKMAKVIEREYGGKMQHFLRRHGENMRDELANAFCIESLNKEQLRYSISLWLQNALSIPISLEHPATIEFCRKNGVTLEDLLHAADELDLNIALLDDLLEIDNKIGKAAIEERSSEGS